MPPQRSDRPHGINTLPRPLVALFRRRGDARWDWLLRGTGLLALVSIPLVSWLPRATPLVWLGVLSLPANSPLSPVTPTAFEPMIMEAAKYARPAYVALVALAGYLYMEYLNWHVYAWVLNWDRFAPLRTRRWVRRAVSYFERSPLVAVVVFAFTPLPFWVVRCLAILNGYSLRRFLTATAAGRFPRFLLYAWFGAWLKVPTVALVAVALGGVVVVVAGKLRRGEPLLDDPILGASLGDALATGSARLTPPDPSPGSP